MNLYSSESDDDNSRPSKTKSSIMICIENGTTQVDDSGHRIPQDSAGKMQESHRILHESTGNCWKMEAVFWPEMFRILPVDSCQLPVLSGRNRAESIGKNPKNFRPEYCFQKITVITQNRPFPGWTVRPWQNLFDPKHYSTIEDTYWSREYSLSWYRY
jgi:hypothetical protein